MKTKILHGDRLGKQGELRLGCSAILFNETREKVFLTRRTDNDMWCLPSGRVDSGESVEEAVLREFHEETGLYGQVTRFIGVYSDPNRLVVYPDGNKAHIVSLSFEVKTIGGQADVSDETTAFGFFTLDEIKKLEMLSGHTERILDGLKPEGAPFVK